MKEYHRTAGLEECVLHQFEDSQFYIMKGYDEALHEKYGLQNRLCLKFLQKAQKHHSNGCTLNKTLNRLKEYPWIAYEII